MLVADQMNLMAVFALLQGMVPAETLPMLFLIRRKGAGSHAQGAGIIQGVQDGLADKFRAVRQIFQHPEKRAVHLESDNLLLCLFHQPYALVLIFISHLIIT